MARGGGGGRERINEALSDRRAPADPVEAGAEDEKRRSASSASGALRLQTLERRRLHARPAGDAAPAARRPLPSILHLDLSSPLRSFYPASPTPISPSSPPDSPPSPPSTCTTVKVAIWLYSVSINSLLQRIFEEILGNDTQLDPNSLIFKRTQIRTPGHSIRSDLFPPLKLGYPQDSSNIYNAIFFFFGVISGVTDAGLVALGRGLPFLQSLLDVSCCRKITDKGVKAIALGCNDLRKLELSGCRLITNELFRALSDNCCHLEELGLSGCTNVTDSGLSDLVEGCRYIRSLDVSKCSKVGDDGVLRIAGACSASLQALKLLDCYGVGDRSIISLADSCRNLETLVFGGCRDVSDEPLKSLVLALGCSLRSLRMDWCLNVSDSSLLCVLSNCRNLVALDISCCGKVTDSAFDGLAMGGFDSGLKVLKVSNVPRITVLGIGTILQCCKVLEYLDLRSLPHVTEIGCQQAGLSFPSCCRVNFTGSLMESHPTADLYF
ncbi:uncharacterized protein A4U43_C10F910 [Asparagus officinalis]|uniref:F-box/LRR-repeat protein 15-like leucin rich repeat domain-containing protein n=1 Tax=Asparagus officinalis TaxID=4686 RepID=A0A5P1DZM2_ASPOF|nr:uncharacterized protein A4U43_C10F910 [Asparagus officinalis]